MLGYGQCADFVKGFVAFFGFICAFAPVSRMLEEGGRAFLPVDTPCLVRAEGSSWKCIYVKTGAPHGPWLWLYFLLCRVQLVIETNALSSASWDLPTCLGKQITGGGSEFDPTLGFPGRTIHMLWDCLLTPLRSRAGGVASTRCTSMWGVGC